VPRFRMILASALAALLGAGGAVAIAHAVSYETAGDITSTNSGSTGAIGGTVFSDDNSECSFGRRMTVYRKKPGADRKIRETERTNDEGRALFVYPNGLKPGKYYALVARKRLPPKTANHKHVCLAHRTDAGQFEFPDANP